MLGVGTLINKCDEPIGIQLNMTALDKHGEPVSTKDMWPASIRNIPPGKFTFSLDYWLDYQPGIKSFTLEAVSIKRW